jgi:triacylglycerol lipase
VFATMCFPLQSCQIGMPKFEVIEKPSKLLANCTAAELVLKSSLKGAEGESLAGSLAGSLADMSLVQRGLLFAEAAMISYLREDQFQQALAHIGFVLRSAFDSEHGKVYLLETEQDLLVLFRGSSEQDWDDLAEEQRAEKEGAIFAETVGKVNHCFKEDVDHLWPLIEVELAGIRKPVWFAGHSLGGAFAIICANRCLLSYIRCEPEELHTFGAPRVGTGKYVRLVELKHYRWVNNHDYVTRVPAAWRGYRHCGQEMHIDYQGQLRNVSSWERFYNSLICWIKTRLKGKRHREEDHSIKQYVQRIFELYRQETPIRPPVKPGHH